MICAQHAHNLCVGVCVGVPTSVFTGSTMNVLEEKLFASPDIHLSNPIQPSQPTPLHAILSHPSSRTASHSAIQPTNHNWNFINLSENSMMMMTTMFCSITPQSSMAKGWRLRLWLCVYVVPTFLCYSCCCKQLPTSSSSIFLLLLLLLLQNKSYQKVF